MTQSDDDPPRAARGLGGILRALRRLRGRRPTDVATAMPLAQRSYEHFESGAARLNMERVIRFAEVTDTDGFAILAGLWMGSEAFALRCADNKLMTILVMTLQDFDATTGDAIATLDAQTLVSAFEQAFAGLRDEARRRTADGWLQDHAARLPRGPRRS